MVLLNGAGAIGGPIVGAAALHVFGPGTLFVVLGVAYLVVAAYAGRAASTPATAPWATPSRAAAFVGCAGAAGVLAALERDHPDRVRCAIVVDNPDLRLDAPEVFADAVTDRLRHAVTPA